MNRLTAVTVETTGVAFRSSAPMTLLSTSYRPGSFDVSRDGTRFLMIKEDPEVRLPNTPIVLVTNVVELLRARP